MKITFSFFADAGHGAYHAPVCSITYLGKISEQAAMADAAGEMEAKYGPDWRGLVGKVDVTPT